MSGEAIANVECEAALLGALMYEPKLIDPIADRLSGPMFYEPLHGRIYDSIVTLHGQGKSANPVTLKPYFEADPSIRELGGVGYLGQLSGSGAAVVGAKDFAEQVRELSQRRALSIALQEAVQAASDPNVSLDVAGEIADQALAEAREGEDLAGEYTAAEAVQLVIDGMSEPVRGVRCGIIPAIDTLLGPLRPSHLIIGAGRPGMGKTASALSYARGAAERGHGVLFVSLEMDAEQLAERLIADACLEQGIRYDSIRDRTLTSDEKLEVCRVHDRIRDLPLQILDKQGLTVSALRRLVRRWKRRFTARGQSLELVVVDYLQLMGGDASNGRYELVTEISRGLKGIAKSEGLAVLALSQLSRKVEDREDKRPTLSDLRESGQIEQDADAVIFFLRLEYYLQQSEPLQGDKKRLEWEQALQGCRGAIEFICAKRRNGRVGTRFGRFIGDSQAVR